MVIVAGVPEFASHVAIWTIPPLEIAVGSALLLRCGSRMAVLIAQGLLLSFIIFLGKLWHADPVASCGCFGPMIEAWTMGGIGVAITRNILLMAALWFVWLKGLTS